MANTKIIKQKIKAIGSIKKITKTMEMISFAKMKKSSESLQKINSYILETKELIARIVQDVEISSPLFENNNQSKSDLVLIFASSKGLCGSFNSNIYKDVRKLIQENPEIKSAICFGKFANKIAKRLNLNIEFSLEKIEKVNSYTEFIDLEKYIRKSFLDKKYNKIFVSYTNYIKNGFYENASIKLYPFTKEFFPKKNNVENAISIYEPNKNVLLENLFPKLVNVLLYSFLLESRASEYSMRSFAMKRANESAGDLLSDLKLKFNKVRQDGITQEIAEISAGAMS